jgi:hypothetical protein
MAVDVGIHVAPPKARLQQAHRELVWPAVAEAESENCRGFCRAVVPSFSLLFLLLVAVAVVGSVSTRLCLSLFLSLSLVSGRLGENFVRAKSDLYVWGSLGERSVSRKE